MLRKIGCFLFLEILICIGSFTLCFAEDNQKQLSAVSEQDEMFKKSMAKVIFFLSILGSVAYFAKRYNEKGRVDSKLSGAIKLLDETNIRGTKFALLEILDKKILVASNQSGSLEMLDLKVSNQNLHETKLDLVQNCNEK